MNAYHFKMYHWQWHDLRAKGMPLIYSQSSFRAILRENYDDLNMFLVPQFIYGFFLVYSKTHFCSRFLKIEKNFFCCPHYLVLVRINLVLVICGHSSLKYDINFFLQRLIQCD
jgi:hypothetical protein